MRRSTAASRLLLPYPRLSPSSVMTAGSHMAHIWSKVCDGTFSSPHSHVLLQTPSSFPPCCPIKSCHSYYSIIIIIVIITIDIVIIISLDCMEFLSCWLRMIAFFRQFTGDFWDFFVKRFFCGVVNCLLPSEGGWS